MKTPDETIQDVTFCTNCWERDWKHVLSDRRLRLLVERNPYPFSERVLLINNVKNLRACAKRAEEAVALGAFTQYFFVQEHAQAALDCLGIDRCEVGLGYWYSMAEYVSVFLCESDYLLSYKGDCIPFDATDWITPSHELMASDPRIKVCNPVWNKKYDQVKAQTDEESDAFCIGYGFSDQCFLVRTADIRGDIYGYRHPVSERYPVHAGELFEKRVDAWMRNKKFLRGTYKHSSYEHLNWPRNPVERVGHFYRWLVRRLGGNIASVADVAAD